MTGMYEPVQAGAATVEFDFENGGWRGLIKGRGYVARAYTSKLGTWERILSLLQGECKHLAIGDTVELVKAQILAEGGTL